MEPLVKKEEGANHSLWMRNVVLLSVAFGICFFGKYL